MNLPSEVGSGYSDKPDGFDAGKHAAINACGTQKPEFIILFSNAKYIPQEVLKGVLSVTGEIPLVGGAALGVFNNTELSYEGYECLVIAFFSKSIRFDTFYVEDINKGEYESGKSMAEKINTRLDDTARGLLVFYETAKSEQPPMLNFATPLFAALDEMLPKNLVIAGGGLLSNMQLTNGFQYLNNKVMHQSAVGVLFSGDCDFSTTIIHGCVPGSSYHTITKSSGPVIFEINHKPALEVIGKLVHKSDKLDWKTFPLFITLGVNKGEKFGEFKETDYANRLCLAVDEENKAMIMFEPDLKEGDEFQMMHRNVTRESLEKAVTNIMSRQKTKKVLLNFYINCAGRAKPYSGADFEDAKELQSILGDGTLFTGFYSGVEVARINGSLQALDWTGVMCTLSI